MLNMEQESNELFEDVVEARETYGCAYAEVIRDMDGNVIQLEFIEDTPQRGKEPEAGPTRRGGIFPPGPHREPHEEVPQV